MKALIDVYIYDDEVYTYDGILTEAEANLFCDENDKAERIFDRIGISILDMLEMKDTTEYLRICNMYEEVVKDLCDTWIKDHTFVSKLEINLDDVIKKA